MSLNSHDRQSRAGSRTLLYGTAIVAVAAVTMCAVLVLTWRRSPAPAERRELGRVTVEWAARPGAVKNPTLYSSPSDVESHALPMIDTVEKHLGAFETKPVVLVVDSIGDGGNSAPGFIPETGKLLVARLTGRLRLKDFVEARLAEIRGGEVPPALRDGLVVAMERTASSVDWESRDQKEAFVTVAAMERLEGKSLREIARSDVSKFPAQADVEGPVRVFSRLVSDQTYRGRHPHWVKTIFREKRLPTWTHYNEQAFDWRKHTDGDQYLAAQLVFDHWLAKNRKIVPDRLTLADLPPIEKARKELIEEDLIQLLAILGTEQLMNAKCLRLDDVEIGKARKVRLLTRAEALAEPGKELAQRAVATGVLIAYALHTSGYSIDEIANWSRSRWERRGKIRSAPEGREPIDVIRMSTDPRLKSLEVEP